MSTPTTRAAWLYPRRYLWKTSEKAMALQLDGATRLYPIIGDPIIYARSPTVFSAGLAARGRNALCVPLEAPDGALDAVMQCLGASRNVDGFLVTMPHKFTTFPYCATVTDTSLGCCGWSACSGAIATAAGTATCQAFVAAQIAGGAAPKGAKVLLLGAGGAGSAIAIRLLEVGVGELIIHDPDAARQARLIALLGAIGGARVRGGGPDPRGCDMVCNATPLGMAAGDPLPLDPALLSAGMFVGDVIAGHGLTPFLAAAVGLRLARQLTATRWSRRCRRSCWTSCWEARRAAEGNRGSDAD